MKAVIKTKSVAVQRSFNLHYSKQKLLSEPFVFLHSPVFSIEGLHDIINPAGPYQFPDCVEEDLWMSEEDGEQDRVKAYVALPGKIIFYKDIISVRHLN